MMLRHAFAFVLVFFVIAAGIFGLARLDQDEFRVIKEPYEMLGGDYTLGYLRAREFGRALDCAGRAYRFYWQYRPLLSPIITDRDRHLFAEEERRFGYIKPATADSLQLDVYRKRLIVPEPERFYRQGAGAPLLSGFARIPGLALVRLATAHGPDLLEYQFTRLYHPIFLLPRLQGLLAGFLCVVLVFHILLKEVPRSTAVLGAAIFAALPAGLIWFPNMHYDAVLAPFVLLASYLFVRERHLLGGLAFGLALASKNTAVFVLPAAVLFVALEALRLRRLEGESAAFAFARQRFRGFAIFCLASLVTLTPFANPISHAREILTPIVARQYDPRGENLAKYNLTAPQAKAGGAAGVRDEQGAVARVKALVSYSLPMLFVVLALPVLWGRLPTPMTRYGFCFLLMMFPYSLIFGNGLGYRSLMFLPFFALIGPQVLQRRALVGILVVLLLIDIVFAMDPIAARGMI